MMVVPAAHDLTPPDPDAHIKAGVGDMGFAHQAGRSEEGRAAWRDNSEVSIAQVRRICRTRFDELVEKRSYEDGAIVIAASKPFGGSAGIRFVRCSL
jgi:hypothetical protein